MKLDLLVTNARIITMDPARPAARSMGVWQGKIVGFDDDLRLEDHLREIDLGGATVVPGFIDAHCHTAWFGQTLVGLDCSRATSWEEVYQEIHERSHQLKPNEWILGAGLTPSNLSGSRDLGDLDRAAGNHPLYLRHTSGHALTTNSEGLRRAGFFDGGFNAPGGGGIPTDEAGNPTGLVEENAQECIQDLLKPYPEEMIVESLDLATRRYASEGITSFTDAGIGLGWIGHSPLEFAAYQTAVDSGRLHARAQVMPVMDTLRELPVAGELGPSESRPRRGLDLGIRTGSGSDRLSVGPVKIFSDGSLLGETSAMHEALCGGRHSRGEFLIPPERLQEVAEEAYTAGWSLAIHAIGDRAVDVAMDVIDRCQTEHGSRRVRNRIEHVGLTSPDQVRRLARLNIAVTPQAAFIGALGDHMSTLVGPNKTGWLYRGKSLTDAGVCVAGSSDRPVADGRPLLGIQRAVDRTTDSGVVVGPEERLNPYQALKTYTVNAAEATGFGESRGRLAPGFDADFAVLSESPLGAESIVDIDVLATYVSGEETYSTS